MKCYYCIAFLNALGREDHLADTTYLQMSKYTKIKIALLFSVICVLIFMENINGKNPLNKSKSKVFLLLLQP